MRGAESGGLIRPSAGIAQALDITLPTVTVAVKRLEKKGYVVKRRDEYDGGVQRVELTPRGRKMDAAHKYFHQIMCGPSPDQ